jgi:1-aminocyclopropane-1-carboxylate deaminase/D-cysteine desulfhydrase-like pyridoxal-dependent ACC family enzyme
MEMFHLSPSPLQKLDLPLLEKHQVELYVKRDDLLHPLISGNKWRKLKYNVLELKHLGKAGIVTFGGAFSNHLHAVAAAGKEFHFKTIGIVRGERAEALSKTLVECEEMGMVLHFVTRLAYREKESAPKVRLILAQYPDCLLIPEGGANEQARRGCAEIMGEIDIPFDYFCTACGTGTTLAGLVSANGKGVTLLGFPVLKGMLNYPSIPSDKYQLIPHYHFGGYANHTPELLQFIRDFERDTSIPLDQVYTGKLMFGVLDLIGKGFFPKGSRIVALHTGGLQGRLPELDA